MDVDCTAWQTEGAGIAVGAGKRSLQLGLAGIVQVGESVLTAVHEDEGSRAYVSNGERSRKLRSGDRIGTGEVERKNIGFRAAARDAAEDRVAHTLCLGGAGIKGGADAGVVVVVVSEAVKPVAGSAACR